MIRLSHTPSTGRFTLELVTLTAWGALWATRLGLEPVLLLGAVAAVIDLAGAWTGVLFAGAVAWHLVATRDRVRWLLGRRDRGVASVRHRHTPIEEVAP